MLLLLLLSPVQACTGPALFCQQDLLHLQKNNPADQDYLVQTPEGQVKNFNLKGIVWEIYECFSDVFSHLGRMFGMIFRVQWGQKSPKSGKMCLTKMYLGPCKVAAGSLQGCRRGLVRVPQVGAAYQVWHPCKDPGTFWSNTL